MSPRLDDQPHSSYTYTAARTVAALGVRDEVAGEIFHASNGPATTTRRIAGIDAEALGSAVGLRVVLRLMGLVDATVRELDEMRYEFTQPFALDEAIAHAVAWVRWATPR